MKLNLLLYSLFYLDPCFYYLYAKNSQEHTLLFFLYLKEDSSKLEKQIHFSKYVKMFHFTQVLENETGLIPLCPLGHHNLSLGTLHEAEQTRAAFRLHRRCLMLGSLSACCGCLWLCLLPCFLSLKIK